MKSFSLKLIFFLKFLFGKLCQERGKFYLFAIRLDVFALMKNSHYHYFVFSPKKTEINFFSFGMQKRIKFSKQFLTKFQKLKEKRKIKEIMLLSIIIFSPKKNIFKFTIAFQTNKNELFMFYFSFHFISNFSEKKEEKLNFLAMHN